MNITGKIGQVLLKAYWSASAARASERVSTNQHELSPEGVRLDHRHTPDETVALAVYPKNLTKG
jgi:hypothetical protein